MRYAIIADIHSNLEAFQAVLADIAGRGGADVFWCLGDVVGYGPDPRECVEVLKKLDHICVAGNHDLAAIGKIGTEEFNPEAAAAVRWTLAQLNTSDVEYLSGLPITLKQGDFTLVHGTPRDPVWEYMLSLSQAAENFGHFATRFCLVGHSHVPLVFTENGGKVREQALAEKIGLTGRTRRIINPGGVGQPRDGDARAAYAVYDSEKQNITPYRVAYDIKETQAKMRERGLPERLAARLGYGV